ncbi:MAG: hypothetical protein WAK93_22005, partial [Solirubrobacteraceae bacterium]
TKHAVVVKLVNGQRSGPEMGIFPEILNSQDNQLAEDANGGLVAAYESKPANGQTFNRLFIRTSRNGRHWTAPREIYHVGSHDGIAGLETALAPDGGGVAVFVHGSIHDGNELGAFSIGGQIVAVPFGRSGSTGQKGLGQLSAGTTPGEAGCLDVRFGAVHAHVDSGCFLRDPDDPTGSAAIAYGGVHVNGLELRPDAPGTAIVIDPRKHTIDSVHGTVSILLQHPGVPDIKIWDGTLHAYLGSHDNPGDLLFPLPMSGFHANVLGFEALGTPDVILGKESVTIPVALQLPAYLGVTGSATLAANSTDDLEPASLHMTIPDMIFPGLEASHASIDWDGPAQQWSGTTELQTQPGAGASGLDVDGARIAFDHGEFTSGGFTAAPYPGTPIHSNADLTDFDAAVDLHPPRSFSGQAEMGANPKGDHTYALEATGTFHVDFGNPSTMTVSGDGSLYGLLPLTNAVATFTTDGDFSEAGQLGFDGFGVTLAGRVDAAAALGAGTVSGQLDGEFSVFGITIASKVIPFNDSGFGACQSEGVGPASVSAGFIFRFNGPPTVSLTDCDSDLASAGVAQARAANADDFPVVPGSDTEELDVQGSTGAPSVILTSPSGQTVVPSLTDRHAAAIALALPAGHLTAVAIRHPAAGTWHVSAAAGSSPIAAVAAGRGYASPKVTGRVTGSRDRRTLHYTATLHPGLTVQFAEYRHGRLIGVIGSAKHARGTLRFVPEAGPAGARNIVALLSGSGVVPRTELIASYRAPAPQRPGRARVRLSHRGREFLIRIGTARHAARYLVTAKTTSGRRVRTLVSAQRRELSVPASGWSDRITVSVIAVNAGGHSGRLARATLKLRFAAPKFHRRKARPTPHRRRHRHA